MTETFNIKDFYQKMPILINEKDRLAIESDGKYTELFGACTHWLIALEGNNFAQKRFQWRVVIFPSSEDGQFNWRLPFFQSPFLHSFNEAAELSKKIELLAKQDQLISLRYS